MQIRSGILTFRCRSSLAIVEFARPTSGKKPFPIAPIIGIFVAIICATEVLSSGQKIRFMRVKDGSTGGEVANAPVARRKLCVGSRCDGADEISYSSNCKPTEIEC